MNASPSVSVTAITPAPLPADFRTLSEKRRDASLSRRTFSGGTNGGRPRITTRCPCGLMSRTRAAKRNHKCREYAKAA